GTELCYCRPEVFGPSSRSSGGKALFSESDRILFSASDLNAWLGCRHATFLDLQALNGIGQAAQADEADDPQLALVQRKGMEHEQRYLDLLRSSGQDIVAIDSRGNLTERVAQTLKAMQRGAEIIYQAAFL